MKSVNRAAESVVVQTWDVYGDVCLKQFMAGFVTIGKNTVTRSSRLKNVAFSSRSARLVSAFNATSVR
jgi:hypothetical protein